MINDGFLNGLHGNFAWSCAAEGCANDKNSTCTGIPFIAGTSIEGPHAYAECVDDILDNPERYEDENLVLHGTHQLTDDLIEEIYGPDRGMPPSDRWPADTYTTVSNGPDDKTDYVTVAIDKDNETIVLTAEILHDLLTHPDNYTPHGWTLYGTHILPEHMLDELFGEKNQN